MKYFYMENEASKATYQLNEEYLTFLLNPRKIVTRSFLDRLWKNILFVKMLLDKKIRYRNLYDDCLRSEDSVYKSKCVYEIQSKLPRIVIYTCILGNYDKLYEPMYRNQHYDFYAVTDFDLPHNSKWKRIDIQTIKFPEELDIIRKARYIKTHPHLIFPESDISIWIDGNIIAIADMVPLILTMKKREFLGIHLHPCRRLIETEAKAILTLKRKVNRNELYEQVKCYKEEGYCDEIDLLESTILIRKHQNELCIKLMEEWWNEILRFSTRDQISLPYVLWKNRVSLDDICILGRDLRLNPRFRYMLHN